MELYGFLHFGVNTFTDKEWGYGDESPSVFHPTQFDADQIARVAVAGGLRGLILTCKHHDGFCLWPSAHTEHSVRHSSWRNGRGDVVREISDACRDHGLKFGAYLSPWDRNHRDYARPEYVRYYRNQLRELLTGYGHLFEVWFDGANGGDGFYGGARERREIDGRTYYDWENTWSIVRELQPGACMFSDVGPDVRWVGNEKGIAGDPCWHAVQRSRSVPGIADLDRLNRGDRDGTDWLPAECDVSIRPGWFYHAAQDDKVRSPENLLDLYYKSVGRGASLLLNLPPDRRGQIHENDARSLAALQDRLQTIFRTDLARSARLAASSTRGNSSRFSPSHLTDGEPDTFWCAEDDVTAAEIILDFGHPIQFNVVSLREPLPLGQRIDRYALDVDRHGRWEEYAQGTAIGHRRLIRATACTTPRMRLRILEARACPALSEIRVHFDPKAS
jgi:alpha-L-fucosidase